MRPRSTKAQTDQGTLPYPEGVQESHAVAGEIMYFSLIYVKSFLNAFKKYFSEDFMSRQILEIGSQDKGNCQINSTVLTVESLI